MKTNPHLTEDQKRFVMENHSTTFVREIAAILEVDEVLVRNFVKYKKLRVMKLPYIPKSKRTPEVNGFFNVDFYQGDYTWIV